MALRTPIYDEMVRIVKDDDITFSHKFNEPVIRSAFENYVFSNLRTITRSIITWYAYTFSDQQLLKCNESFNLEHIYAKKRQEMHGELQDENNLESLGNKVLLENSINIKASDYRFDDKRKIYSNEVRRGKNKNPSKITEIINLSKYEKFDEQQIIERKEIILNKFFDFLRNENLIIENS